MREALRLSPTAPIRVVLAHEDTTLGGKYFVAKGAKILVNIDSAQRDPKVYGEDVRVMYTHIDVSDLVHGICSRTSSAPNVCSMGSLSNYP